MPQRDSVACDGSWGSSGGCGGDGCPRPHLPLVIVVVAQLGVLGHCLLFRFCLPPHCCGHCWYARFLLWLHSSPSPLHEQLLAVVVGPHCPVLPPMTHPVNSGSGGYCFSPCFSSYSLFPPHKWLLEVAVGGAVMVSDCPCPSSSHCPPCKQGLTVAVVP
jgi:hypothetical protein